MIAFRSQFVSGRLDPQNSLYGVHRLGLSQLVDQQMRSVIYHVCNRRLWMPLYATLDEQLFLQLNGKVKMDLKLWP